jgi:hypothetical protein
MEDTNVSVKSQPHYTVPAAELARWIESQPDKWWSVDGDTHLMSVLDFPCPGDELAPALRRVGKDLVIYDKAPASASRGERIGADRLTALAETGPRKRRMIFRLSWCDSEVQWLLLEDEAMVAR